MLRVKDTSTQHRTQLQTSVQVGRRRETVSVCIPGRDVWAYQMARIELQNMELQARKRMAVEHASLNAKLHPVARHLEKVTPKIG